MVAVEATRLEIFEAHLLLPEDAEFLDDIRARIGSGAAAPAIRARRRRSGGGAVRAAGGESAAWALELPDAAAVRRRLVSG